MREGILAAGNFIVDRVKVIDGYPEQDTLANILSETASNGGGPFNVLMDLARMGVKYPLFAAGLIGDDADGQWILEHCAQYGIDAKGLGRSGGLPTSYTDVMTVEPTGRRTFFHQRGANAGFEGAGVDFRKAKARIFYLGYLMLLDQLDSFGEDGRTTASHLLERAGRAGMVTAVDLVSASHEKFGEIVRSSIPFMDVLFLNEIEAGRILGREIDELEGAAREILNEGVRRMVVVHTENHAVVVTTEGEGFCQDSVKVPDEEIAGANGAGDAFAAGFLHVLHEGGGVAEALENAVRIAAQSLRDATPSGGVREI